jgi:hypothetical protein
MNRILAHKNTLSSFLVCMWFVMSYIIYTWIPAQNSNYFQVGIPFVCLSVIAFLLHKHNVWRNKNILHGSILSSFGIGVGCVLWVLLGCLLLWEWELVNIGVMSVALLGALNGVLIFALMGLLEDMVWVILVIALWGDLWLNLGSDLWIILWNDFGFHLNTITTSSSLNIAIWVTLAWLIINFYLNYKRLCFIEAMDLTE